MLVITAEIDERVRWRLVKVDSVTIPLGIGYYIADLERIWRRNLHRFGNHQHVLREIARGSFPSCGAPGFNVHRFDNRLHVLQHGCLEHAPWKELRMEGATSMHTLLHRCHR